MFIFDSSAPNPEFSTHKVSIKWSTSETYTCSFSQNVPLRMLPSVIPSSRKDWQTHSVSPTNQWDLDTNFLNGFLTVSRGARFTITSLEQTVVSKSLSRFLMPGAQLSDIPDGLVDEAGKALWVGLALHSDMPAALFSESWLKLLYCCTLVNVFCLPPPHSFYSCLWVGSVVLKVGLRMLHLAQISAFYCWSPSGLTISPVFVWDF